MHVPPCSEKVRVQAVSSTAQSRIDPGVAKQLPSYSRQRVAHHHPVDPILDSTKDGGGISESSSQRPRSSCVATAKLLSAA